jgi:hypothetical protein
VPIFCPAASGDPAKPAARHSLTDPIENFARDSILRPKTPFQMVPGTDPNDWHFSLEPYAWAMSLQGDIGVKGFPPSAIDLSKRAVLQHLQWGIFARGELRKGRWGVLADGYYAALAASASPDNRVYESVNLAVQQSIVSLALAYRIIDDRRGFLDIYAGTRYNFLGAQMDASLNTSRISQIGANTADAVVQRIDAGLEARLSRAIANASGTSVSGIADAALSRVGRREALAILLRDRDLRDLVRRGVAQRELVGGGVRGALGDYIRASALAKAAAAKGIVDPQLQAAVVKSKARLGKAFADRIEEVTPTYSAGDQWWFDPIIGLRGQINFTRWLFLAAQGDVGGFGAGSQIAWYVQSTIGINFTRNLFAEIGYRYMYVDYENDGFVYNVNTYGIFTGFGVRF